MSIQRRDYEQRSVVVATYPTWARAEFVQTTLAVHGIQSSIAPCIIPSVDFVQGVQVSVVATDEDEARRILESLGLARGSG